MIHWTELEPVCLQRGAIESLRKSASIDVDEGTGTTGPDRDRADVEEGREIRGCLDAIGHADRAPEREMHRTVVHRLPSDAGLQHAHSVDADVFPSTRLPTGAAVIVSGGQSATATCAQDFSTCTDAASGFAAFERAYRSIARNAANDAVSCVRDIERSI